MPNYELVHLIVSDARYQYRLPSRGVDSARRNHLECQRPQAAGVSRIEFDLCRIECLNKSPLMLINSHRFTWRTLHGDAHLVTPSICADRHSDLRSQYDPRTGSFLALLWPGNGEQGRRTIRDLSRRRRGRLARATRHSLQVSDEQIST